jgi:hypothetical protein
LAIVTLTLVIVSSTLAIVTPKLGIVNITLAIACPKIYPMLAIQKGGHR